MIDTHKPWSISYRSLNGWYGLLKSIRIILIVDACNGLSGVLAIRLRLACIVEDFLHAAGAEQFE